MNLKVSVVVAVYNTAQYVEQCVRSLFGQTLVDMEFIFVDDKSSDGSMDIVSRVLEEYPNRKEQVQIIYHEENQGVANTKNDGIKRAKGEYLIIIDPDDYVELNMMEEMYRKAVDTRSDIVICDYYRFYGEVNRMETAVPDGVQEGGANVRDDIINRRFPPFCVIRLIKRTLFFQQDFEWPVGRFAEDIVYSVVTAYNAKKIEHLAAPFYHYRCDGKSLTHVDDEESLMSNYRGNMSNVDIMIRFLEKKGVEKKYWRGILIQKLRVRNRILPLTKKWKYRGLWFRTYPEINRVLFFGNGQYHSTYREKIWFFAVATGLYPKFKKYLGGKHLRPFPEWPAW